MMTEGHCIAVADNHPLYLGQCTRLLNQHIADISVVECGSVAELIKVLQSKKSLKLVLLGLNLPHADTFSGFRDIRRRFPNLDVCVVSDTLDAGLVRRSKVLGAAGFIPKSLATKDWLFATRKLLDGETWFPTSLQSKAHQHQSLSSLRGSIALTPVQGMILDSLRRGLKNGEIADELGMAPATVKHHVTQVMKKLGVNTRTQAVVVTSNPISPQLQHICHA